MVWPKKIASTRRRSSADLGRSADESADTALRSAGGANRASRVAAVATSASWTLWGLKWLC
eukprot:scaffold537_cov241-Pinguiococcus_pyrenoidosus.AAC.12